MNDLNEPPIAAERVDPSPPTRHGTVPQLADLAAAFGVLTVLPLRRPDPHSPEFARATLFFPIVGLIVGTVLVAVDWLVAQRIFVWSAAIVLCVCWESISRFRTLWAAADVERVSQAWLRVLVGASLMTKIVGLAALSPTRFVALIFAPLLGRWAMVVLATGARDAAAPNRKFNSGVTFREFALTSVFTFAVCFSIAELGGVIVVVVAAAVTLALRLFLHRSPAGVSWTALLIGCELIEAVVVALIAAAAGC